MTIEISVSEVRVALMQAGGSAHAGSGEPATMLLGRIFHEVFADVVSADPSISGLQLIAESGPDPARRVEQLLEHVWRRLVGPRLRRHAAVLQTSSEAVLGLWQAVRNLCRWMVAVVVELLAQSPEARASSHQLASFLQAEVPLVCELRPAGWTEPVRLVGIADSILRVPGKANYCAIELKLGRATPPVDLGQAALYHLIVSRTGQSEASSSLALMRFSPDLEEIVVRGEQLTAAQDLLVQLIGRLTGVTPVGSPPAADRPAPPKGDAGQGDRVNPKPQPAASGSAAGSQDDPYEDLGKRLVRAYREHGVHIELRDRTIAGPRFLRFDIRLTSGTKLDGLRKRSKEVQLRLNFEFEPIVSQDAGHLYVDLARPDPEAVLFSAVAPQLPKLDALRGSSRVPIGVDAGGRLQFVDIGASGRFAHAGRGDRGERKERMAPHDARRPDLREYPRHPAHRDSRSEAGSLQ